MGTLSLTNFAESINDATLGRQTFCMLSSSLGVQVFNLGNYLYARVVQVAENQIVFSSSSISIPSSGNAFMSENPQSICALSSTKFVFTYKNSNSYCYAIAGTVSGTNITLGTAVNVSDSVAITPSFSITPVASNSFVIAYYDSTNTILRAGTVSIRTITLGTKVIGYSGTSDLPVVKNVSTSAFVLVNADSNNYLVFRPATLSTTTITLGTATTSSLYYPYVQPKIEVLSSTSFIVMCLDVETFNVGLVVCSTNNSTVTVNTFCNLLDFVYLNGLYTFLISSSLIGIAYSSADAYYTYVTTASISGTSASLNSGDTLDISRYNASGTLTWLQSQVATAGTQFVVSEIQNNGNPILMGFLINYTAPTGGKKWGGITIAKWNVIAPAKINSI